MISLEKAVVTKISADDEDRMKAVKIVVLIYIVMM